MRGQGGGSLPPLAGAARAATGGGGGGGPLSKLGGLLRAGGSRDLAADGEPAVARSALSGSSKTPFPPDRTCLASDFDWTKHSRDLPPEVRPIVEDNRMLSEELRRYRSRLGELEGALAAADRTAAALRDELARERQRLRQCAAVSPEQLLQEQAFRQGLAERDTTIRQLQQRAEVLERAKAAAERRFAGDLAAERRQQAELKWQLRLLQDQAAEKDKQDRFQRLQINQLYRRLAPLEAAVAAAAAAPPPLPPPEPAPLPEPEVQVKLMLVHVYAQPQPTAAEVAEAAARLAAEEAARAAAALRQRQAAAAVRLQSAARGFLARRRLAAQHVAATAIQAAARGMLVRRALADRLPRYAASEGASDGSADTPPGWRRQAAERQYLQRAAAAKAKPQRRLPARPGTRSANTAVEAAARKRGQPQQPQQANAGTTGGSGRRHSSLLGQGGASSGASSPPRRASAVAMRRPSHAASFKSGDDCNTGAAMLSPCSADGISPAGRASAGGSPGSAGGCSPAGRMGVRRGSVPRLDLLQEGQDGGDSRHSSDSRGGRRESQSHQGPRQLGFGGSAPRMSMAGN